MVTQELTADELSNFLVDGIYYDGVVNSIDGDNCLSLTSNSSMVRAYIWVEPGNIIAITQGRYDELISQASTDGYTPLAIVGTPEGVYEFNLDTMVLNFEPYSEEPFPDVMVADLDISRGKRILDFWPDFSSEEEYLDALMSDAPGDDW